MVTEDDVRRIALSLPETAEKPYNRLPSFRVRSTLFLRMHELPDTLFMRCTDLDERNELLKASRANSSSRPTTTATRGSSSGLARLTVTN